MVASAFIKILLTFHIFAGISSILVTFLDEKNQNFLLNFFLCNLKTEYFVETENITVVEVSRVNLLNLSMFFRASMIFPSGCDFLITSDFRFKYL